MKTSLHLGLTTEEGEVLNLNYLENYKTTSTIVIPERACPNNLIVYQLTLLIDYTFYYYDGDAFKSPAALSIPWSLDMVSI